MGWEHGGILIASVIPLLLVVAAILGAVLESSAKSQSCEGLRSSCCRLPIAFVLPEAVRTCRKTLP